MSDQQLSELESRPGDLGSETVVTQTGVSSLHGATDSQVAGATALALGSNQPKLTEAVTLMEANIEEPISLDELSSYVGISRRQLERLFQKHLQCVPTRYYLEIRLRFCHGTGGVRMGERRSSGGQAKPGESPYSSMERGYTSSRLEPRRGRTTWSLGCSKGASSVTMEEVEQLGS